MSASTSSGIKNADNIIRMLITNPIYFFGDPEFSENKNSLLTFGLFKANDVELMGFGDDVLIVSPETSLFYRQNANKMIAQFQALYAPCEINNVARFEIPEKANFIITTTLTGCSIVADTSASKPSLTHINRQNHLGETDTQLMEQDIQNALSKNSKHSFVIKKEDYFDPKNPLPLTVFGIKMNSEIYIFGQRISAGRIEKLITNMPPNQLAYWNNEMVQREKVLAYRDNLYEKILKNQIDYAKQSSAVDVTFVYKSQKFHAKVPASLLEVFDLVVLAKTGQMGWAEADDLISKRLGKEEKSMISSFAKMFARLKDSSLGVSSSNDDTKFGKTKKK